MMTYRPKMTIIAPLLAVSLSLAGCETGPSGPQVGTALGVIGGAVIGSQFGTGTGRVAATAAGALVGGWIGHELGQKLSRQDHAYMNNATYNAANTGYSQNWSNPNSQAYGTAIPTNTYVQNGQKCTTINQNVTAGGQSQSGAILACDMPNGTIQLRPL